MDIHELNKHFPAAAAYLSQILLIERDYGNVNNTRLAKRLKVSKSAVTQSVKRLVKLGLLTQDPYDSIHLTPEGRTAANEVIIRHYLIEHLLIEKLAYPWDKADTEALLLQGVMSEELTQFLFEAFNHPDRCPHGNPFPGVYAEEALLSAPRLSSMNSDTKITIVRITEEGEDYEGLLHFCNIHDLRPGRTLTVDKLMDEAVIVSFMPSLKTLEIPHSFAQYICVSQHK